MARRRRFRKHGRKSGGFMSMVNKAVTPVAFASAFVPQITQKDTTASGATYTALAPLEKGKFLANSIAGRVTGFNPFPQYGTHSLTINPQGALNKYTGMGIGLMILSEVLPKGIGGKSLAKKVGKGWFWGGIIGGFFDDPVGGATNTTAYGQMIQHSGGAGNALA